MYVIKLSDRVIPTAPIESLGPRHLGMLFEKLLQGVFLVLNANADNFMTLWMILLVCVNAIG